MFTAQWTTNRWGAKYRYYRCSKKKGVCSQRYVSEDVLASQIKDRLQTISLCDAYTDYMLSRADTWGREEKATSHSEIQHLTEQVKASEARMEKLVGVYLDGDIPKENYLKQKDEIMRATLASRQQLKDAERGRKNWVEPLREWVTDTKQANFLASSNDLHQIKSFVQKIGTNPSVRDKSAQFQVPAPSEFAARMRGQMPPRPPQVGAGFALSPEEVSICDPTENRTPLPALRRRCPSR